MSERNIDIPSGRIRFALQALEEFDATPGCRAEMSTFRKISKISFECIACLGGAAYSKLERHDLSTESGKHQFESGLICEFEISLDQFRIGCVGAGFSTMNLDPRNGEPFDRFISDYHSFNGKSRFTADLNKLADDLEQAGY